MDNQQYLEYLIDQYQKLIFSICYKTTQNYFEAEDLTQEVFLSAFKSLSSFDRTYEKAWLSRIALNKCLDYQKQGARRIQATEQEELHELLPAVESIEKKVLQDEVMEQLKRACDGLKSPYKEVALSYYYEEKDMQEIAKEQNKNLKTIQTQIYRARGLLRKWYGKELRT